MRFRLLLMLLVFPPLCSQVITPTVPGIPASTSVFADQGDLTYCQTAAVRGSVPAFTLTCRRAGTTYLTSTVIKSSGVFANGDIVWSFVWDVSKPFLVHVQASVNVRDPNIQVAVITWPSLGMTQEFQMGEQVTDASGAKSGTVLHWSHQYGSTHVDGVTNTLFNATISLSNVTGGPFVMGDRVTGQNTGAWGLIGSIQPVTSNKMKSAFDVEWTPATSANFMRRAWRATLGRL